MGLRPAVQRPSVPRWSRHQSRLDPAPPGAGDRVHPRRSPARRARAHRGLVGERDARTSDATAVRPRSADRQGGCPGAVGGDRRGLRCAHAECRRRGVRALGRQSAEVPRGPRDARRAKAPHRLSPDARHRRRRAGRGVGVDSSSAVGGPGRAAALGRPRGAHRALGHAARHPPRPHRRHARPGDPDPGRLGVVHDRREEGTAV